MKKRNALIIAVTCLFLSGHSFSQSELKAKLADLMANSEITYHEVVQQADLLFENYESENPRLDGVRAKYERWKNFWKDKLDASGMRVDYTSYFTSKMSINAKTTNDCDGLEIDVNWTNLNYNDHLGLQIDHGRTNAIGFSPSNPDVFYVGAGWGGLWKTEDGGQSYINVNDRLPLSAVSGILIDPANEDHLIIALSDIVWYGTSGIGVFESMDGGVSFQATDVAYSLNQNRRIYGLAMDPSNASNLFAATSTGLLRSNDNFASYTTVINSSIRKVQFCHADPTVIYATTNDGRLYKSSDSGASFQFLIDFGSSSARLDVDLNDPDRVVVSYNDELHISTDGGANFTQYQMPESNCVVSFVPGTAASIVVGNFDIYRSDDGGASFYQICHWLGDNNLPVIHVDQRNSFVNPFNAQDVYFCNDGGVFRYNVASNDFTNLSKDLIITQYYDIAVSDVDTMVVGGGSQDNGNITRNTDGSWEAYAPTGDGMEQAIHLSNPDIRFWEYQFGSINRYDATTGNNTPITPLAQTSNGAWHTPFVLDPNDHNRMISGYQRVYESNNLGDSWNYLGSNFTGGDDLQELAMAPSNSDCIYAATSYDLWRKTESTDWEARTLPFGFLNVNGIVVDQNDQDEIYICSGGFSVGKKVFRSIDGGQTWENLSFDLPNLPFTAMRLLDQQMGASESGLFVGTIGAVYYLPEGGTEWFKFGCLPVTEVSDIEIQYSSNKIFAGNAWKRNL